MCPRGEKGNETRQPFRTGIETDGEDARLDFEEDEEQVSFYNQ